MVESKYNAFKAWLVELSKNPNTDAKTKDNIGAFLKFADENPASNDLMRILVDNTSLGDVATATQAASGAYRDVVMTNNIVGYLKTLKAATAEYTELAQTSSRTIKSVGTATTEYTKLAQTSSKTIESVGHQAKTSIGNAERAFVNNAYGLGISGALLFTTLAAYFAARTYRLVRPNQR